MIRTATLHDTTALMALAKAIELFSAMMSIPFGLRTMMMG
jgi:hypothetical protein